MQRKSDKNAFSSADKCFLSNDKQDERGNALRVTVAEVEMLRIAELERKILLGENRYVKVRREIAACILRQEPFKPRL